MPNEYGNSNPSMYAAGRKSDGIMPRYNCKHVYTANITEEEQ